MTPSTVANAARREAWKRLWTRLLAEPPPTPPDNKVPAGDEPAGTEGGR